MRKPTSRAMTRKEYKEYRNSLIRQAIDRNDGNISKAANDAGYTRTYLYNLMKRDKSLREYVEDVKGRIRDNSDQEVVGVLAKHTGSALYSLPSLENVGKDRILRILQTPSGKKAFLEHKLRVLEREYKDVYGDDVPLPSSILKLAGDTLEIAD